MSQNYEELLQFIYGLEANGDYDQWNHGTRIRGDKPLTSMTVAEVLDIQRQNLKLPKGKQFTAAGAGQFIYKTLQEEVGKGTVALDDLFNAETQDRLALSRLKMRGLESWQSGRISTQEFGNRLAKEWASLPVLQNTYRGSKFIPRGETYYGGVSTNATKSKSSPAQFEAVLGDPSGRTTTRSAVEGAITEATGTNTVEDAVAEALLSSKSDQHPLTDPANGEYPFGARSRYNLHNQSAENDYYEVPDYGAVDVSLKRPKGAAGQGSVGAAGQTDVPAWDMAPDGYVPNIGEGGGQILGVGWGEAFMSGFADGYLVRQGQRQWFDATENRDPTFDPFTRMEKEGTLEHWRILSGAKNDTHYERLAQTIENDRIRDRRMMAYDGWVAPLLGGFANPDSLVAMLLPGGVGVSMLRTTGRNALRMTVSGAAVSGATEAAFESGRRHLDAYSTPEESIMRVGAATLLGGLIYGGTGALRARGIRNTLKNDLTRELAERAGYRAMPKEAIINGKKYKVVLTEDGKMNLENLRGVEVVDGKVVVDDRIILQRFEDGDVPDGIKTPDELVAWELGRLEAEMEPVRMSVEGDIPKGKAKPEGITMATVDKNGKIKVKQQELKRRMEAGENIVLGFKTDKADMRTSLPPSVFKNQKQAAEVVREAHRITARARDIGEWERNMQSMLQSKLGIDLPGFKRREASRKRMEAEAAARRLDEYRRKNNQILKDSRAKAIARMVDSPYKRVHFKAMTPDTRDLVDLLAADGGLARGSDGSGMAMPPSVYSRGRTWLGVVRSLYDRETELYGKYLGIEAEISVGDINIKRAFKMRKTRPDGSKAMSVEEFRDAVTKAHITGTRHAVPEVNEMVEHLRSAFNEYKKVGSELGVISSKALKLMKKQQLLKRKAEMAPKKYADELEEVTRELEEILDEPSGDYFSRVYSQPAIRENRKAFKEQVVKPWMRQQPWVEVWLPSRAELLEQIDNLENNGGTARQLQNLRKRFQEAGDKGQWTRVKASMDPDDIDARAEDLIDTLLQEADQADATTNRSPHRPAFGRGRQFDVPNTHLLKDGPEGNGIADFIETDYLLVNQIYAERIGPAIEMARSFARPADGVTWEQGFRERLEFVKQAEYVEWNKARAETIERGPTGENVHPAYRKLLDDMGLEGVGLRVAKLPNGVKGAYSSKNNTITISHDKGDMATVFHEGLHAVWENAGLAETFRMYLAGTNAVKLEPALLIGQHYQKQFKNQRKLGRLAPEEDEYLATVGGYWFGHPGVEKKSARAFVEFLNDIRAEERANMGLEPGPRVELTDAEYAELDAAFDRSLNRKYHQFMDHWAPIERDILHLQTRVTNRTIRRPDRWDNRTATVLRNWAHLATMGRSALSATVEVGNLVAHHGVKRVWQSAFHDLDTALGRAIKAGKIEGRKAGAILDVQLGASLSRWAETGFDSVHGSNPERWLKTASNKYFVWNGLASMTTILKEMDMSIRVSDTVAMIRDVADGVGTPEQMKHLNRYGISKDMAKRMAREPIYEEDGHWFANTDAWGSEDLVRSFRAAIAQGNENTVMLATAADKPIIVDGTVYIRKGQLDVDAAAKEGGLESVGDYWRVQSGLATLPFTYWSYSIAAMNKILISGIDEPSARKLAGIGAMVGMGYMVAQLKAGEKWDILSADEKIGKALEQSGILGVLPEYRELIMGPGWERSGLDAVADWAGAGPTVAKDAVVGAATLDVDQFENALPWQNHLVLGQLFDAAVDGIERGRAGG